MSSDTGDGPSLDDLEDFEGIDDDSRNPADIDDFAQGEAVKVAPQYVVQPEPNSKSSSAFAASSRDGTHVDVVEAVTEVETMRDPILVAYCDVVEAAARDEQESDPLLAAQLQAYLQYPGSFASDKSMPETGAKMPTLVAQPGGPAESPAASQRVATKSSKACVRTDEAFDTWTTLMVCNLPPELSQPDFVEKIMKDGYVGFFDFIYMPMNLSGHGNFGYAFINFTSHDIAAQLVRHSKPDTWTSNWSTCQGLSSIIERYRNSPVMHQLVPNDCKPTLYDRSGNPTAFPEPTKPIPKPRIRSKAGKVSKCQSV